MSGPLAAVLSEIDAGTGTVSLMARHTGLNPEVLQTALDHLIRTGKVDVEQMPFGCPPAGCGACEVDGCGTASSGAGRTMLTLLRRR